MYGMRGLRAFRVKDLEVDGCEISLGEIGTALGVVTSGFFSGQTGAGGTCGSYRIEKKDG